MKIIIKNLLFFCLMLFVTNTSMISFAMDPSEDESTQTSAPHKEIRVEEQLLKFIVDVYSIEEWDRNRKAEIKSRLIELSGRVPGLSAERPEIGRRLEQELTFRAYNIAIKEMKSFVIAKIREIYADSFVFIYIIQIYNDILSAGLAEKPLASSLCDDLFKEITRKQIEEEAEREHMLIIRELLRGQLHLNVLNIKKNELSGANPGFVVIADNGYKYFIKTFSEVPQSPSSATRKVDCRELFAYKVLEYLGYGPETDCLMQSFSTSGGSTAKGNYIVTKDVATIHPDERVSVLKKEFFRDSDDNIDAYKQAMESTEFLENLFALASLNSILRLQDTFGDNTGNYGIIETTMKDGIIKYEPVLIDHLHCTSNGMINADYSPGRFIEFRLGLRANQERESCIRHAISEFGATGGFSSRDRQLVASVRAKVMRGKKETSAFDTAIRDAREYVLKKIAENNACFTDDYDQHGNPMSAEQLLDWHIKVVERNYKTFCDNYKD
ncbi:MAG: hypothetical protein ACD_21C00267G0002 [uncultured bacterium]|nr:MAG: hypothetical protein ACD_21C00267G0002 [uncultured bacterium]